MAVKSILGQLLFANPSPDVPDLKAIDLGEEQQKSIAANKAALPGAQDLATQVNQFNQDALLKSLRSVLPGIDKLIAQTSENLQDWSEGKLGKAATDELQNFSASRGLASTGTPLLDSGFNRALVGRDVAKASYEIAQAALKSTESWLATGRQYLTAPQMDVTSAFISSVQQAQFDVSERNTMWNYDWFKNQYESQRKEGWEMAVEGLLDWVANTGLSVASMGLGNVMGGMGGGASKTSMEAPTGSYYQGSDWSNNFLDSGFS